MTGRQVMTGRCVESVEPLYNWGRLARTGAEPTPSPRYRQIRRGQKYNVEKHQRRQSRARNQKPERRDA